MSKRSTGRASGPEARLSGPPTDDLAGLSPRRRPLQERARLTVAAITEAAGRLLVERGYAQVSTNLIARRAGVSVGSLYQYFPNKEAIYAAILQGHIDEMRDLGERALVTLADPSLTFSAALRQVIESMVAVHHRDDDLMRALQVELSHVLPHWRKSEGDEEYLVQRIADIIAARDDCRATDPLVAARLSLTCCQGVTQWLLHRAPRGVDTTTYIDQTVRMCELAVDFHDDLAAG